MSDAPLLLDSITDADTGARGKIVICGSHGGLYPAAIASRAGIRAVVFNDAGIGLDQAGVAGVLALAEVGMAALAVDCHSCRIGSAINTLAQGRVSVANEVAAELGCKAGRAVADMVDLLSSAPVPAAQLAPVSEGRKRVSLGADQPPVHLLDSASLVGRIDIDQIVVTGSHGGLIGGDVSRALKAKARLAVFNDAGFGLDEIGVTRLAALQQQGIAALTVSCNSARIGDARSALETGIISCANMIAQDLGAKPGIPLQEFLRCLALTG